MRIMTHHYKEHICISVHTNILSFYSILVIKPFKSTVYVEHLTVTLIWWFGDVD